MGYQDFDGTGGSKSNDKLKALSLEGIAARLGRDPSRLYEGFSVLDIGCNEGFFCIDALKRGASRVVGVDFSQAFVDAARKRCPEATYIKANWWDLPDEKFDIIYFMSAMHYERRPREFFDKLRGHLNPKGTLVLECGVVPATGLGRKTWRTVKRWDGVKRYPTSDLLVNELLSSFAVRPIGASVNQGGDPIPRFVYHCQPKLSTALLIYGPSGQGKSGLDFMLTEKGIPSYSTDALFVHLHKDPIYAWRPVAVALKEYLTTNPVNWGAAGRHLVQAGFSADFAEIISDECPSECEVFAIQGEALINEPIRSALLAKLKQRGVRPWLLGPA